MDPMDPKKEKTTELRKAVDTLYLYDPQFEPAANRFLSEVGGSTAIQPIKTWEDVKAAASNYALVKFLVVDTHGLPGTVYLPNGTPVKAPEFKALASNPQFLKPDARVLFLGCNIGEGSEGDKFMDGIGKHLLGGKGGTVGAATVSTTVLQLGPFATESYLDPASSGKARLKVKRYDASSKNTGSRAVDRNGKPR